MLTKKAEVKIEFNDLSPEQLKHLFKAESELGKAGVSFDTGYSFGPKIRVWEFDWSLGGADVVFVRFKGNGNAHNKKRSQS
ncbi:hypothetical protein LCGC14_2348140 [marine sediment metagenome]|uniref:Uncharacterized protein n=1 Tax=marine sediment metagenome TaxID=412755 RepID=A0A0F9EMM3_9ZZZZ